MDPRVSVVITSYNLGWCIEDTLRSVLAQTYKNIEIIVVDDASTDDTAARITPFLDRVKYIRHTENQGVLNNAEAGPARNSGIDAASGEYIAIMDGDDLWEPEKISAQVDAAKRFPEAGIIVADGVCFASDDGTTLRSTLLVDSTDDYLRDLPDGTVLEIDLYPRLLNGCLVDTPSQVMYTAEVFRAVGSFSVRKCDDYDFLLRAAAKFRAVIIKRTLVRYRFHRLNLSGPADRQFFRFIQPNVTILKAHLDECRASVKSTIHQRIKYMLVSAAERARDEGERGDRAFARGFLSRLLMNNGSSSVSPYLAYHLVLLWCPRWLAAKLKPVTRRASRFMNTRFARTSANG